VHVGGDDDLAGIGEQAFLALQELRNDADDLAAVIVDRAGDGSHQADGTAAEDKPDAACGENLTEAAGGGNEAGIMSPIGSAIDTDALDLAHYSVWH